MAGPKDQEDKKEEQQKNDNNEILEDGLQDPGDEEILAFDTLNINEEINKLNQENNEIGQDAPSGGKKRRRRTVKFQEENRSIDEILGSVVFAVDADGNHYEDYYDIARELGKKGRQLFLFQNDGELPYAYENRGGKLYVSDRQISSENQLPGNQFEPAGSLDVDQILGGNEKENIRKANEQYIKARNRFDEKAAPLQRNLRELKTQQKDMVKQKPKRTAPLKKAPTFSWGSRILRWGYKMITLGFGETDAYRKYQTDKADYEKYLKDASSPEGKYQNELKDYNDRRKELKTKVDTAQKQLDDLRAPLKEAEEARELAVALHRRGREKGQQKIRDYRDNLEVKLEGVADLIKEQKITGKNVFANTWLKKAECEGKDPSDPDVRSKFEEYMASRMVEEQLLHQTVASDLDSRTASEETRLMNRLNTKDAERQLRGDSAFMSILDDMEDLGEYIDTEEAYETMITRSREKAKENHSPVRKLENAKKALIEEFGTKPVTEDSVQDVYRLNMLNQGIEQAKKKDNYKPQEADLLIADLYRSPEKRYFTFTEVPTEAETRNALKTLGEQQGDKKFGLEEMAGMVNADVNVQKRNNSLESDLESLIV